MVILCYSKAASILRAKNFFNSNYSKHIQTKALLQEHIFGNEDTTWQIPHLISASSSLHPAAPTSAVAVWYMHFVMHLANASSESAVLTVPILSSKASNSCQKGVQKQSRSTKRGHCTSAAPIYSQETNKKTFVINKKMLI